MSNNQTSSVAIRKQQAGDLFKAGEYEQAKLRYQELLHENCLDAEAYYMLGSSCGELGEFANAAGYFRLSIEQFPGAFITHCALGSALKELGELAEAEQSFRNALRLKPADPDVLAALANVLIHQDRLEDAEQYLHEALQTGPAAANVLHSLGSIYHLRRQLDRAIDYYTRSLKINPDQGRTHNQLGYALYTLGKIFDAISHYREALRIAPDYAEAHINLGHSLLLCGNVEEAKTAFRNVLKSNPDNLDAIAGEASALDYEGDFQAVHDRCLPVVRQGILHAGIGFAYARICRHFKGCEAAADYLEQVLEIKGHKITTEEQLHFTLGDLYDALGDYDRAFSHYRQGNATKPDTFRPVEYASINHTIMETFSWQFLMSAPRSTIRSERPVFVVGMPRSGTTLAEQVLASHPAVHGAGELTDIADLVGRLSGKLGIPPGFPQNMRRLGQADVDSMAETYLAHIDRLAPDAVRVIDKMPQNFIYLGLIALAFPDARVVHCTRDPRDTCLSIYFQNFNDQQNYSSKLEYLGFYYREYRKLMQHWRSLLDIPIMELRYEDMIGDQESTSRRLLDFAGLEWDDRVLDFHRTERAVVTASYDQVRQPIYKSSSQRWLNYEKHLEPLLKALGDT